MGTTTALLLALMTAAPVPTARPEEVGMSSRDLADFTRWVRDNPVPLFSVLVSRHHKLVYELYTSSIDPDASHYLMSVTKSVLSAAIGVAVDRHLMVDPDQPISAFLPKAVFPSEADWNRLRPLTLKRVMGMAAFDAPDPPRDRSPEARAWQQRFWSATNRATAALGEPLLTVPFQYNDATPAVASAALSYATGKSAFDFAKEVIFDPMGFSNEEWLHQDPSGLDNGGFGIRLRPVDMVAFGTLFLDGGVYGGKRILSKEWVQRSFHPWNRSDPKLEQPNYGWFWWTQTYAPGWTTHAAIGWQGQRIAVIPEQDIVVAMTAAIEDGSENDFFAALVNKTLRPSVEHGAQGSHDAKASAELAQLIDETHRGPSRFSDWIQYRMVPSVERKRQHRPFQPPATAR